MDILEAKKIEDKNFKMAIRQWPHFFESQTFIDEKRFLEKYGIQIPEKKKLPLGYLKLWPQDFIVEEISFNGELQTIFPDKFRHKKRDFLPEDPIIYATLVKCGLSTIEVIEELAKKLNLEPKNLKYAGIKDKHAITSQLISVKEGEIEKLHQISSPNFFLKNVFSGKREIYLGKLKANQFTILIRTGPDFKEKEFLNRLKEIEKNGFYNFYYYQRFGTPRLIAHYCGLYILKGDYEKAVRTALCRSGVREPVYFQNLRKEVEKLWGNWSEIEGILEFFPMTFRNEIKMVKYLINNPTDFIGALKQIPTKQVWLWVDAFSSLLFNQKLSFYLREGRKIPRALPLILSENKKNWLPYEELLKQCGIFSITFALKNLGPFPFIVRKGGERETKKTVKLLDYKILPEGVILNFNLSPGCYATTFLSHLFNLVSGNLPKKFSNLPIDTKANLNQQSLEEILNKFTDVVSSPSWRYLWRIY